MKKPIVIRNYRLTDAVLKQKADEMVVLLDRDAVEFAERGYDNRAKDAFTDAILVVDTQTADETLEASKMIFTENKNAARSVLEKSMRTLFNMAANKFGNKSAKYKSFGQADISNQSDSELVRTFKIMAIAARENLAELVSEGLTQEKIDKLNDYGVALDDNIDAAAKGVSDRDIATEKRVEELNALYALVIKYAGIGQDVFYELNEAKYNDYVIYDTPSGLPPEDGDGPIE
jgi:hypothetical protein